MRPANECLVMVALRRGDSYPSALVGRLRGFMGKRAVYAALERLEARELVFSRPGYAAGRRRRLYTLTMRGRTLATDAEARLLGLLD